MNGAYIGFRAPRELKRMLAKAAAENGRSLSTEVQFRLERSFWSEATLRQIRETVQREMDEERVERNFQLAQDEIVDIIARQKEE